MPHQPLVSIITITYNAEKYLERTILSVINQTYPHIEYLIIDGQSKDNTLAIAQKYANKISAIVSEPDRGIYDAMNKGQNLAKGEYVWFMNAGDEIYAPDTLQKIMDTSPDADIYYGETEFFDLNRQPLGIRSEATPLKLPQQLKWQDLQMGLMVCHQAILVRRRLAEPYDLNHPYSADIDWVIRALKKAQKIVNTQQIVAVYLQGGFSRRHLIRSLQDRFAIMRKHYGWFTTAFNHFRIGLRSVAYLIQKRKTY
ncbi:MAG: glycosyltransferase [Microscillaceae bacterium]|jgi:glycosyltransferase involved in cell wall biosynthesis|nr:glycosyltransferase [Microscillaceae bacterium]